MMADWNPYCDSFTGRIMGVFVRQKALKCASNCIIELGLPRQCKSKIKVLPGGRTRDRTLDLSRVKEEPRLQGGHSRPYVESKNTLQCKDFMQYLTSNGHTWP